MRDLYEGLSPEVQFRVNDARSSVSHYETTPEAALESIGGVRPAQQRVLTGCLTAIASGNCVAYPRQEQN